MDANFKTHRLPEFLFSVHCSSLDRNSEVFGFGRFGFNSRGAEYVAENLSKFRQRQAADPERARGGLVGVNLGKNKTTEDAAADYVTGLQKLGMHADYLVINVSSPNTPGEPHPPPSAAPLISISPYTHASPWAVVDMDPMKIPYLCSCCPWDSNLATTGLKMPSDLSGL